MKQAVANFILANGSLLSVLASTLLLWVVANLANGLLKFPQTETLGRSILDRISVTTNADAPNTFKKLGKRSTNPTALVSK